MPSFPAKNIKEAVQVTRRKAVDTVTVAATLRDAQVKDVT